MGSIIGIDLGTTNSVAAILVEGNVTVILHGDDQLFPSVVARHADRQYIGKSALKQAANNPRNTIFAVKRYMGKPYYDRDVQTALQQAAYTVMPDINQGIWLNLDGVLYSPEDVSALILGAIKRNAEAYLGAPVTDAVITVPAYFDHDQRNATHRAGQKAGLQVQRIINEPTASALAYGLADIRDQRIAVYDMGGGTFDVSFLETTRGVFKVLSTRGDPFLGGNDFDQRITDWLSETFYQQTHIDLRQHPRALHNVRIAAEHAKKRLSFQPQVQISLPNLIQGQRLEAVLSQSAFETMVEDLIQRSLDLSYVAMQDANLRRTDIDTAVLVGGMTSMPYIQRKITQFFGKLPRVVPNPEEIVAVGAAIQGGIINGDIRNIRLIDVVPHTLRIKTEGNRADVVINRNTPIPVRKTFEVCPIRDNQTAVNIEILQGEHHIAHRNKSLGYFTLDGIPPGRRGTVFIEVIYDVDVNGMLDVSARELTTNRRHAIRLTPHGMLDDGDTTEVEVF
jgi:molecular chaperone DnaK